MSRRALSLAAAIVLTLAIAFVSALPTQVKHAMHTQGRLHPWLHLAGFALLAALLVNATRSRLLQSVFVIALMVFGYATEAGESHKDGWPIEQKDVRTDAEGVLLGSVAGLLIEALVKGRWQRSPAPWHYRPPQGPEA